MITVPNCINILFITYMILYNTEMLYMHKNS